MGTIQAQTWKSTQFNIEREAGKTPGAVIFRLTGPFTARDMYGTLTPVALREIFENTSGNVHILDLTGVPYMDSAGLGMIASQYARCQSAGIQLIAVGACPRLLEQFRITHLDTLILFATTIEDAETQ